MKAVLRVGNPYIVEIHENNKLIKSRLYLYVKLEHSDMFNLLQVYEGEEIIAGVYEFKTEECAQKFMDDINDKFGIIKNN